MTTVQLGNYCLSTGLVKLCLFKPDTGSSDLWIISETCVTDLCTNSAATRYPQAEFVSSGVNVTMQYGDSTSGTFASGPIGKDQTTLAGLSVSDQQFVAIDNTTNPTVSFGIAGIFGLGFPSERFADTFPDTFPS